MFPDPTEVSRGLSGVLPYYNKALAEKPVSKVVQWSLHARELKLLIDRRSKAVPLPPDTTTQGLESDLKILEEKRKAEVSYPNTVTTSLYSGPVLDDYIAIIDLDADGPNKGYNVIKLPFIPKEVSWNSEPSFVAIKPMGRNLPKYHYVGAEDRLEFEIDWHSFDENREDVIRNCRAIESLSKNDAYNNPPHRVAVMWGMYDRLFSNHVFIVLSATYTLNQFNKNQYSKNTILNTALLPIQAYQKVVLGRISSNNLRKKDIEYF